MRTSRNQEAGPVSVPSRPDLEAVPALPKGARPYQSPGYRLKRLLLVVSYRQVIRAYPQGGGAYMVSRDNLGPFFASLCGAALLIDYVLTVAVSVSAGTAALASAVDPIGDWRVELSVAFVAVL